MNKLTIKRITSPVRHWYVPLIIGLIFIALAVYVIYKPESSFVTLATIFSLSFLISGVFEMLFAWSNKDEMENWQVILIFGVIHAVIGLLLITHPGLSVLALALYIGFAILFRSIMAVITALDLKRHGASWQPTLIFGILGVIVSFILIRNPDIAGLTVVFWTSLACFVIGIVSVILALKLRKVHEVVQKIRD